VSFLDIARPLAERNVPVVRLRPRTKIAADSDWPALATTDLTKLTEWDAETPDANCGVVAIAKIGGIWLFEIDSPDVLARIEAETGQKIPMTYRVRSRPGRGHFYWKQTPESIAMGNISQSYVKHGDFSVRVNNEYVVAAGSTHPISGLPYEMVCNQPIIEAPVWLIDWIKAQRTTNKKLDAALEGEKIPHGSHDSTLFRIACKLRNIGLEEEGIYNHIVEVCENRCEGYGTDYLDMCRAKAIQACKYPVGKADPTVFMGTKPLDGATTGCSPVVARANPTEKTSYEETEMYSLDQYKNVMASENLNELLEDEDQVETTVPPFDPSVMTGFYKDCTHLVIRGTTLAPQFVFGVIKTFVGIRMAGNVTFDDVDDEPRRIFAAIGETGSGKGVAFKRVEAIMLAKGSLDKCHIKITDSADSGAGLKDFFFQQPENDPVLCYIDEIESLGDKASEGRNPDILNVIIELADRTKISRILADRNGKPRSKHKDNARLAAVICGQNGLIYGKAFGKRAPLGIFDRMTPEYGEPVIAADLPPIPTLEAIEMLNRFVSLPYGSSAVENDGGKKKSHMTMARDAKQRLVDFWNAQSPFVKSKARFRRNLLLDAYLTAFGRSTPEKPVLCVEMEDAEIAIKNHLREMIIRRVNFNSPASDRVSYYIAKCKEATNGMVKGLINGKDPQFLAMSERDYAKTTHAYKLNEGHVFKQAWRNHSDMYLVKVAVPKANGQLCAKYLPAPRG